MLTSDNHEIPGRDMTEDNGGETVSVTKAALAHARGISLTSAERLIRRRGWQKTADNDGKIRVLVPRTWLERPRDNTGDKAPDTARDGPAGVRSDNSRAAAFEAAVATLGDALAVLKTELEHERARADRAEAEAGEARSRADRAEARADKAEARAEVAETVMASLEAEIAALRQEKAERRENWLARIMAVLRRG
jgi:hypothetical protein